MHCDDIRAIMDSLHLCEETEFGLRVRTHCLYPSFSPVDVFVAKIGDSFRIHDGASAAREAWLHGRDHVLISGCLKREAENYRLKVLDGSMVADAHNEEWLASAILSVANASAAAANSAVARLSAAAEESLVERIADALSRSFNKDKIVREFPLRGKSGKEHRFDFALLDHGREQIIIDAISPHHTSISAKYVSFADADGPSIHKFAVYDKPLLRDDVSLMQQVAEIVPLGALVEGSRRALNG
jgi:hypothetical protein